MIRRLRTLLFALLFAVLGAVAGRVASDIRRQQAAGEEPQLNLDGINLRPRDIAPGVVAAMRVSSRPWSLLHIPPWMAAFSINFAIAAFARELGPLGRMARGEFGEEDDGPQTEFDDASPTAPPAEEPSTAWSAAAADPATGGGEPAGPASSPATGFTPFSQDATRN